MGSDCGPGSASRRGPAAGTVSPHLLDARILVVDDEPANVRILQKLLERVGYRRISSTTDPRKVSSLFDEFQPDLVLLDLHMPHLDGFEVLELLAERIGSDTYLPILFLTGDFDPQVKRRALAMGARDFLNKPFESTEVLLRIKNLLETRELHQELRAYSEGLEEKVKSRTEELAEAQVEILQRLAVAAEYRDDATGRHAARVGAVAALIAHRLGLPAERIHVMRLAAPLHDVGKIGIPDAILMKPGPLTPEEFEVMKTHTTIGGRMLSGSTYSLLDTARIIALNHHEKWDGTGYGAGRAGDEIPLPGRIVAVADVFDSLTHERPYKGAFSADEAMAKIRDGRGSHFDPDVVDAFLAVCDENGLLPIDHLAEVSPAELSQGVEAALKSIR